jgi:hypothetical protein
VFKIKADVQLVTFFSDKVCATINSDIVENLQLSIMYGEYQIGFIAKLVIGTQ